MLNPIDYERLLTVGFRRSGSDIYRPHCRNCVACQSIRIDVNGFSPSRSQKRILKKNHDLRIEISKRDKPAYYQLYERYINVRHQDGSMYPASKMQYQGFILSNWLTPTFIEFLHQDQLIGVAVTDNLPHSLSAMYSFFDPDFEQRSLGALAILTQIRLASEWGKQWLYLGYQIDACSKMNYKTRYRPYQRFSDSYWQLFKN